jgi:hypothetical protein
MKSLRNYYHKIKEETESAQEIGEFKNNNVILSEVNYRNSDN